MRSGAVGLFLLVTTLLVGCAGSDEPVDPPAEVRDTGAGCEVSAPVTGDRDRGGPSEPALRQELLEMKDADQAERTGEVAANNDAARTDRLRAIIDDHGWPTPALVGEDGASAA